LKKQNSLLFQNTLRFPSHINHKLNHPEKGILIYERVKGILFHPSLGARLWRRLRSSFKAWVFEKAKQFAFSKYPSIP